jgi:hypothetical protein
MSAIEHFHCGTRVFDTCPECGATGLFALAIEEQGLNTPVLEGPTEEAAAGDENPAPAKRGRKPAAPAEA